MEKRVVFKRESLSTGQSTEESGPQKERGKSHEDWNRDKRVERQTATNGENWRNELQQSVSAETRRLGSLSHLALLQPSPRHCFTSLRVELKPSSRHKLGWTQAATLTNVLLLAWPNRRVPAGAWSRPRGGGGVVQLMENASDWPEGGVLGCPPAGPLPTKAGPEGSQLEREGPGWRSWKGAGPGAHCAPGRAGGAPGCHKVNGHRRGVRLHGEAHSLLC